MSEKFTVHDIDNIDINALDEEFLKQPAMYRYFATIAEDANTEADRLETNVKVVDAEIEKEIREWAEKNGSKTTEKAVAADVINNPKHKEAMEKAIETRHEARVLNNANVRALDHRKKSLEKLADLWQNGYYSIPKEPKGRKESLRDEAADRHQYEKMDEREKHPPKKSKKRSK